MTTTEPATPKPDHRWLWWLPFLLTSAVFAGWASFTSQRLLGQLIGWDTPWLMPAILDNLAAGTVLAYILIPGAFTAAVSGAVLSVSAVANAQAHFYDPAAADLAVPMWVAIGWSVLPPVAVFTVAHFMVESRKETHDTGTGDDPLPPPGADVGAGHDDGRGAAGDLGTRPPTATTSADGGSPRGDGAPHPPRPARAAKRGGRKTQPDAADVAAWLVAEGYHPGDIGRRRLMELRGDITDHRARQALELFTGNGHP